MGSGKTTAGQILAKKLAVPFIDLDEYIISREELSIPELFRKYSEQGFRDREHKAVLEVSRMQGVVISAGGGAMMFSRNSLPLGRTGEIVFLDVGFEECYRRIAESNRPLVKSSSREQLFQLHETRRECYLALAGHTIRVIGSPRETASAIIRRLDLK